MEKATRDYLAQVAGKAAQIPFHGYMEGKKSNLEPIIRFFPKWTLREADGLWCAAFVYYCCREAGFDIPIRPEECKTCHLAGCIAWEELAAGDPRITYHKGRKGFAPEAGDIVLYDRVFENREHDHIGIVLENRENTIVVAEGNIANRCTLKKRRIVSFKEGETRKEETFYDKAKEGKIVRKTNHQFKPLQLTEEESQWAEWVILRYYPNQKHLRKRNTIVEHPYGTVKRWHGAGYLLTKGKVKVAAEMGLSFLAYNFRRVINLLGIEGTMNMVKA